MSEEDDGDQLVTKPFKFVTAGMSFDSDLRYQTSFVSSRHPMALSIRQTLAGHQALTDFHSRIIGFDARFPNQNQTKHCWQNYVDYHKCILAKGEDFAPCRQFFLAYRSLCPSAWCERWDNQREMGKFPVRLDQ
ncbi:MAG: hypothetical protein Q9222_002457 [Ikaeria aurantiellina]